MKFIDNMKKQISKGKENIIPINKKNREILKEICSRTAPSWHENYYLNVNKYFTCIQVTDFMDYSYSGFMNDIIQSENILVTLDVSHVYQDEYNSEFEKVLKKQSNAQTETKKFRQYLQAKETTQELVSFDNEHKDKRNAVKTCTLRIYVFDTTLEALQSRLDMLCNELSLIDLYGSPQLNNLREDYRALTSFSNPQSKLVSAQTVAQFMARSEVNRIDKTAPLIGYTDNGVIALNVYDFSNYSYDKLILGWKGSGKSALVKALGEGMNLRGNHVLHGLDIEGELKDWCEMNNIPYQSIDENQKINFTQMFFVSNADGIIRVGDIENKIATMVATFDGINDFKREQTNKELSLLLNEVFKDKYLGRSLEALTNDQWFLLEEVAEDVDKKLRSGKYLKVQEEDMNNIRLGLKYMIENLGYIFNEKTNMNFNLNESLIIDISHLNNNSNKKLRSSYVSLMTNYLSYGAYLNRKNNFAVADELGVNLNDLSEPLITHEILIDETKRFCEDKGFLVTLLETNKAQRKSFSGLTLIFHTLHDLKLGEENEHMDELSSLLQQVFGLCTNKFIGKVDADTLRKLPKVLTGITSSDCDIISRFEKGANGERKFFLLDDRGRKTVFTSIVTKHQQNYFGGGR